MNKHLYCIVFNKARGILMVVAENVSAQGSRGGEPGNAAARPEPRFEINALRFAAKLAAGAMVLVMPTAHAQITADPNAPGNQRPTIHQTSNGLPQVNIQTPSAAGVSRNVYSQFDVQSQGAILNNSRHNVQTQTGGWVQGNPWLTGGAARVILNEVNSSNPSQLRGYVEVAGQRAEVIVANPAGIQVNGGGFINASGVTLTTGTAVLNPMNGGSLDAYRIPKGAISVEGLGLDTRSADYTNILARSIEVNAGIWANRLQVVTGANEVSAGKAEYPADVSQGVTPIAGTGPAPRFSLDVAALGGMYAGHIYLVGSEAGLGVRNQGQIAANGGNLVLLSNGFLTNEGAIQAASANGAGGNLKIDAGGQISNLGAEAIIGAQGKADITTRASLRNTEGTIVAGGQMSIESKELANVGGLIQAAGDLSINTRNETLDNRNAALHAAGAGGIVSQGAITIQSGELRNDAGYIGGFGNVGIAAGEISNTDGGQLVSQGAITVVATGVDNTAGTNNLQSGQIQAFGDIGINTGAGTINNTAALIRSAKDITLTAGTVLNDDTAADDAGVEGNAVSVTADTISNRRGGMRSDVETAIASSGTVDNTEGMISSGAAVRLQDGDIRKALAITNTDGTVIAGETLTIDAESVTGDGKLLSVKDLNLVLSGDFTNSGKLQAGDNLTASARNIDNTATGEMASIATTISAQEELTNRGVIDGVNTRLNAETFNNIGTGRVYGDQLSIGAGTLRNDTETVDGVRQDAVIAARNRLDIGVETLVNRDHALIFSAGTGTHALNIGGTLDNDGFATGKATTVTNGSATIESMGDLNIAAAQLDNANLHFTTELEQIGNAVGLLYIQPAGSGTKLLSSNFVWEKWSRAGQYRFADSPPPNNNGILGQSPVPRVGEQDCVGDDEATEVCTRVAGADYLSNNPAWDYFNIAAPAAQPGQPDLTEPTPPNAAGASSCETGPGYNANACEAYATALDDYNTQKQAYDTAWDSYRIAHADWEADTDAKYTQLDNSIAAYNQQFAGSVIRAWTQYSVTRTEHETKVASSDPGQILAGGAIRLTGDDLINDKSRIVAGGVLAGDLVNLRNIEAEGVYVVNEAGSSQYTYSNWRGGFKRYHERRWDSAIGYYPADQVTTITLAVTEKRDGAAPAETGTQVAVLTTADSTQAATIGSAAHAVGALPSTLPSNSLFQQNPDPLAKYLIETDARFTNMQQWLGSDYMLSALESDPAAVQKRLGDGFYEQQLVREQVAELTGRRFLDSYASDETQYQALMDAGVTYAKQWNLVPGVALTASQMAQLTSDIVWLVGQEVTLADGSKQTVLVPQVYLQVREGDLNGDGTLLAGAAVDLKLAGDLTNAGMIAGHAFTQITSQDMHNLGGRILGDNVALQARGDFNNIGGQVMAKDTLVASAGGDLNVLSTTQSGNNEAGLSSFSRTGIDRVAGLYVTGLGNGQGTMAVSSGKDINIAGAVVANYAKDGATVVQAANDLNLGAIKTSVQESNVRNENNYLKQGSTQDFGSQIITNGDLSLQAGRDINAIAATVNAGQALVVNAARDVNIQAGEESTNLSESRQHKTSGFLSKKTVTKRTSDEQTNAIASDFGGETILINSGRDVTVAGSNVIADADATILAANDLKIERAQTQQTSSSFQETKRSGLFSSGGLSITYGKQKQSADQKNTRTGSAGSTVGSIDGDVTLIAGNHYKQAGSDVIAPGGDIALAAKTVDIVESTDGYANTTEQRFKQSGLTLAITSPVISAVQTVQQMAQAASQTRSSRTQALAGAASALAAKNAYDAIQKGQGIEADGKMNQIATYDAEGNPDGYRDATAAEQVGGLNLSISIGASSSQSKTTQSGTRSTGSNVMAGGDISIVASGAGQDSNVTIQGSNVSAGNNIVIGAENDLNLLAAKNTDEQHSTNKNSSGSIGISFGTDGFGVTASASSGRGNADGSDVTWTNTHIDAGNQLALVSGGDAHLIGAVASGKQVTADVGGDLNIESLQDTSQYDSKQKNVGGSLTIGLGVSGNVSYSKSNIQSDYASVTEQSGIKAGDGGFQVDVQGNTALKGAVIASTEQAVQDGHNSLVTASLTLSDIENKAEYKADAKGVSLGAGSSGGVPNLSGAGVGSDDDHAASTTQSGISDIAGKKEVRTGDAETGIVKIFDAEKVQKEINAQVQITQAFSQQASKAVADYVQTERKALREELREALKSGDDDKKIVIQKQLDDLLLQERVMNVLIGALTGSGATAVTKESLSVAADKMRQLMIQDSQKFVGVTDEISIFDKSGKIFNNDSAESEGVRGDGHKLGGTRIDLDKLCGVDNKNCRIKRDESGIPILDAGGKTQLALSNGLVQFDPEATGMSLVKFLETDKGKMAGATGGIQGIKGTLFGEPYNAGSWQDRLIEAFAGTHDFVGGKFSGLYDDQGNAARGRSGAVKIGQEVWSASGAIVVSAPFAISELLSPEAWQAISILLKAAR